MASFLAIQSATAASLAVVPAAAPGRPAITDVTAASPAIVAASVTVSLSEAARVLAAIGNDADVATTAFAAALTPQTPAGNDPVAATLALQALLADPGLRAIRNQADPLYSALIAASHLSDFVPAMATGIDPNAITIEVPAPVIPAVASRAIDFYRETAAEPRQLASA